LFEQYKKVLMPNLRMGDQDTAAIIDYLARVTAARDKMMKEPAANDPATANSVAKAPSPGNQDLQRH
jgi:hypothetical protein